jgi:hypothetical protein
MPVVALEGMAQQNFPPTSSCSRGVAGAFAAGDSSPGFPRTGSIGTGCRQKQWRLVKRYVAGSRDRLVPALRRESDAPAPGLDLSALTDLLKPASRALRVA